MPKYNNPEDSLRILKLLMIDCSETQSHDQQTTPSIHLEQCPFCHRSFFEGKLQLHLKLCTNDSPMLFSPKKMKGSDLKSDSKSKSLYSCHQRKCPRCQTKMPNFLYDRHVKKCMESRTTSQQLQERPQQQNEINETKKSTTDFNFNEKLQTKFPAIKKIAREHTGSRKPNTRQAYQVKVREELSCFRLAQQIQKIQCINCGRMFAKDAALRHMPICQKITTQEKYDSIFKRKRSPKAIPSPKLEQMQQSKQKKTQSLLYYKKSPPKKLQQKIVMPEVYKEIPKNEQQEVNPQEPQS